MAEAKWRLRFWSKRARIRIGIFLGVVALLLFGSWSCMIRMPGSSHEGDLPDMSPAQALFSKELRADVEKLAVDIGERNVERHGRLRAAADWIAEEFEKAGYSVDRHGYEVDGKTCENIIAELKGTRLPQEIFVVGGHYDSVIGCPGANDNATGAAATLALARRFAGKPAGRTIRFVAFVNEEPPHFQTDLMGSLQYARHCRNNKDKVTAMFSLETMGCYLDEKGSQAYPPPLSLVYPSTGNFIGFVGNLSSGSLVRRAIGSFRKQVEFPSEGASLPGWIPGVGWSDHWAFWQEGYDAIMITDTAPFRYRQYHTTEDTIDKIDFDRMARVVSGVEAMIRDLADR